MLAVPCTWAQKCGVELGGQEGLQVCPVAVGPWVGVSGSPGEGTTLSKCTLGMEWPWSCQEEPQRSPLAALAPAKAATATESIPEGLQSELLLRVGHSSTRQGSAAQSYKCPKTVPPHLPAARRVPSGMNLSLAAALCWVGQHWREKLSPVLVVSTPHLPFPPFQPPLATVQFLSIPLGLFLHTGAPGGSSSVCLG